MSGTDIFFKEEYKKLNSAQKDAVDLIDGPVMVVAGPGTGKTQILALRIANILQKTDIKTDGILCLTFTNSAVEAMKNRLKRYIGEAGEEINIFTFHGFGMKVIEEHFKVLDLPKAPKLLEDIDRAIFFEKILSDNEWEYLRPRANSLRYFHDLQSLISLLKRERITAEDFSAEIKKEIKSLERDENSISTRGESKGELKKEILKEIESLERSGEVVKFMKLYEQAKQEKNLLDYDDILESLTRIVEVSDEVASLIRERYLYVLIDEHQDSSRVQNEFLESVWANVEKPDIFVVGDDRQLIYGFSGASIDHFKGFQNTFRGAKLITLVDNYRSTQLILDASHALLQSVMSDAKLISHNEDRHPIKLVEADSYEEEITAAGLDIKEKMKQGLSANDCAILVPKNRQVRNALYLLHGLGVPVSTLETLDLFEQEEMHAFLRVLKIIDTGDSVSLALSFLDKISGIEPLTAHKFIAGEYMREFSFDKLTGKSATLFSHTDSIHKWVNKLLKWKNDAKNNDTASLIRMIGVELFQDKGVEKELVSGKEILDTVLGLLVREEEKNPDITLSSFVEYLDKLKSYNEFVPLVTTRSAGVKVLTMHSSKGLEFEYVWIAHMDEKSLSGGKKTGFALPHSIAERIEEKDIDAIKRKLYVAITRAKRFCTLSYTGQSVKGGEQELARVIASLPMEIFEKQKFSLSKKIIHKTPDLSALLKLAKEKYQDRYVSVSLLNNFFDCPWQWYFRNLLQIPTPPSASLEFGSQVHSAIDQILKLKKTPNQKELQEMVSGDKEVLKVVSKWVKNSLPEIKPKYENEVSVSVNDGRFPNLKMYGRIDLIENLGPESVRVTDFKTGSVRKKSEIEKIDEEGRMSGNLRQLAMYSYLIEENKKWKVNVSESRLEFLEAKNTKETFYNRVITSKEIELLVKDIKDYDNFIKDGGWISRPCNYNSYGKNSECVYCKMAEMYK